MPVITQAESSAKPAVKQSYYQPELDAIRFPSFFAVFLFHCSFLKVHGEFVYDSVTYAGAFGMSLFFVLSSYRITVLMSTVEYIEVRYKGQMRSTRRTDTISSNGQVIPLLDIPYQWKSAAIPTNNGHLQGQTVQTSEGLSYQQAYEYDTVNRLSAFGEASRRRTFAYDRFANMWVAFKFHF